MESIETIIADIRNDANRGCVYNYDDLMKLADRLENRRRIATEYELGETVELCGDRDFKAVIIAVEETVSHTVNYRLAWRDQRGFTDKWMEGEEIRAILKLKEV